MGRGVVEYETFRSERYEFEERTTDPSSTTEGDAWIRTDIAPATDQIATLRFDNGGSTIDIPLFDSAATTTNVTKVWRVAVGGQTGFIPLSTVGGTYPQLRFKHNSSVLEAHDSLSATAIPDTSMFQSAVYQFWAGTGIGVSDGNVATTWVDALSDVSASATGSPVYRSDQAGFQAVDYGGGQYSHDFTSDSQVSLGSSDTYSVFALFYLPDTTSNNAQIGIDTSMTYINSSGAYAWNSTNSGGITGGSVAVGAWDTIGWVYDAGDMSLYGGGDSTAVASQTDTISPADDWAIGRRPGDDIAHTDGFVAEAIVSAAAESGQSYADYHTDRLG